MRSACRSDVVGAGAEMPAAGRRVTVGRQAGLKLDDTTVVSSNTVRHGAVCERREEEDGQNDFLIFPHPSSRWLLTAPPQVTPKRHNTEHKVIHPAASSEPMPLL